jgi:translation initiation factor 5B
MAKKKKKNKKPTMSRDQILAMYSTKSTSKKIEENVDNNSNTTNNEKNDIKLKAPTLTILGHVDAGKTTLIDSIKETTVAENESGGITQSIGSTFIDIKYIKKVTKNIKGKYAVDAEIPGFLIIDTPGHKSFGNLRKRGCNICDLAILVIDMHDGVKPQTIESLKLLVENKIPFIIAATKIDKIYGWEPTDHQALRKSLKNQKDPNIMNYLISHLEDIKYDLKNEGINSEFYFNNKNPQNVYSIVPVSSKTKEGLADILSLIVYISQNWMNKKLTLKKKFKATILESKKDKKEGWIIDIILSNGQINIGDKFAVSTKEGPKIITIRNILLPDGKNYKQIQNIFASAGVRLIASNLSNCYAGTHLHSLKNINEDEALLKASDEMKGFWDSINLKENGIVIQAETLGELEALSNLLNDNNINVKNGNINPLTEKDILKTETILELEKDKEMRAFLFFGKNIKNSKKLIKLADEKNVKLIISDIIYDLLEKYQKYFEDSIEYKINNFIKSGDVVMPCKLRILKEHIFNKGGKDDMVFGVKVTHGKLYKNTPLIVQSKNVSIGKVISIQSDHKELEEAETHKEVCIKINTDNNMQIGRHFDENDILLSKINSDSLKIMAKYFKKKLNKKNWELLRNIINLIKNN